MPPSKLQPIGEDLLEQVYRGGFLPCKHIHLHSCEWNTWLKFQTVFRAAVKFYVPIHLIPVLIFKRKRIVSE